jgi:hypothetical protein
MPFNRRGGGSSSGGGSSFTGKVAKYNATPPTLADGDLTELQTDSKGTTYTNPGIYNTSSFTQALVVVTTSAPTSGSLLTANTNRTYLLIQNQDATNPIWVSFGGVAVATAACLKIAAGGTFILENSVVSTQALSAISTGNSVNVQVMQAS